MLTRRAEAALTRRPRPRRRMATLPAAWAILLFACSSSAHSLSPLISHTAQKEISSCIPAPDKPAGIDHFDSPIGLTSGLFYNQSAQPITVESVSLLNPHYLVLHGAIVYKMAHYSHPLSPALAWSQESMGVPKSEWNLRQPVPGAIIPPEEGVLASSDFPIKRPDVYEIALDVSATSPAGGWAVGEVVKYRAGTNSYSLTLMTGLAIGGALQSTADPCSAPLKAISAAFASS